MSKEKDELRSRYREIRNGIPSGTQVLKSVAIWKYFFELEEYKKAETVMIYSDIKSEVKTNVFAERIISDGKHVVFPVTDLEKKELYPYEITDTSQLKVQAYGIMEPSIKLIDEGVVKPVSKADIDIVMVPGIVFDMFGDRIGYGGGYYDKFLEDFKGLKVGVTYSECMCYSVPAEENDIRMDMLITEAGCERIEQGI